MLVVKPIPRVLSRRNLLMGGEREPVLLSALLCGGTALSCMTITAFVVCGTFWFILIAVCRWMAKADPQMTRVYVRSLQFKGYYPAFSRPCRERMPGLWQAISTMFWR